MLQLFSDLQLLPAVLDDVVMQYTFWDMRNVKCGQHVDVYVEERGGWQRAIVELLDEERDRVIFSILNGEDRAEEICYDLPRKSDCFVEAGSIYFNMAQSLMSRLASFT